MIEWTHAIVRADGVMCELAQPAGMTLSVPSGASAIAKSQISTWITTYGDLNGVCTQFGWTNGTGENF